MATAPVAEETDEKSVSVSGVLAEVAALPEGAAVSENALARMLGKHPQSIKRAVQRGELPRPFRLFGKPTWLAGSIVRHWTALQERAAEEREALERKITRLSP